MNLSVSAKLYAAAVGALVLLGVMMGVNLYSNQASTRALTLVYENSVQPVIALADINDGLKEIRFRMAGVLLDQMPAVGSRNHLAEVRKLIPQRWSEFKAANRTTGGDEDALVAAVEKGMGALPSFLDRLDAAYAKSDHAALGRLLEDDWPLFISQLLKPIDQLVPVKNGQMAAAYGETKALGTQLNRTAVGIFVASAIGLMGFTFWLVRSIARAVSAVNGALKQVANGDLTVAAEVVSRDEIGSMAEAVNLTVERLRRTLDGVHEASGRLARAAASLQSDASVASERSQAQTENVMQVSAAMEELTVSVAQISSGAENVAHAATESKQVAENSARFMQQNDAAMTRVLAAVGASTEAVSQLSEAIGKISEITKVIEDIANQTNLLALNAAIEAARAGEQGRGFAVVADEVRKLAERTTKSTADITAMIKSVSDKAETAVGAMGTVNADVRDGAGQTRQLGDAFGHIVSGAVSVMQMVGEMSTATKEQTQVATQTSQSMETISRIVEETGATVAGLAQTAAMTAETALELDRLVAQFKTG